MPHSPSYRRILHKMGYYDYQQGLIYRHLNQENGWNQHLDNCRNYLLRALDLIRPEKITILGSGWLLDVPLTELTEKTEKICLVDIVHPPEVIAQTAGMKNVEIIEQDIGGGLIEEVWDKVRKYTFINKPKSLDFIKVPEYQFFDDPGLIVSLNILTQIEILPERFLRKHTKATEEEFIKFRKEVQQKHLSSISSHRSVLLTDTSEVFTDLKGNVSEKKTLLAELPEGSQSESWTWDFDLKSSDYNRQRSVLSVTAKILHE
jgi:hypothetical protein